MASFEQTGKAGMSGEELDELESDLIDLETDMRPPLRRGGDQKTEAIEAVEPSSIRREIVGIYHNGVDIASAVTVYPLIELLNAGSQPIPPHLVVASKEADVYVLQITFAIRLIEGISPEKAEFAVELINHNKEGEMPIVISFFPQETRETLLKATTQAKVGLSGNLNFAVPSEVAIATGLPEASAKIEVTSSFIIGPFNFELRKARILADGINQSRVQWKYLLASDLAGSSEFQSWVVVRVPKNLLALTIKANIGILPYKREWGLFKTRLRPMYGKLEKKINL